MSRGKTIVGIICVTAFVGLAVFIICLYTIPSFTPGGMGGVFIQNKYMTYVDKDLQYIFKENNFLIESDKADIIIRSKYHGAASQGYVQVFEDANGITFNSIKRTQVDFYETLDEDGNVFTKIKVREPSGAMMRTSRVYINLNYIDVGVNLYNFVLNTNRSNVSFQVEDGANPIHMNELRVHGTGKMVFDQPKGSSIQNLLVDSSNAEVVCMAPIKGQVAIRNASRGITLGDVNTESRTGYRDIPNNVGLSVTGSTHSVSAQSVGENVQFETEGKIEVVNTVFGDVNVKADKMVNVGIGRITGNLDIRGTNNVYSYQDGTEYDENGIYQGADVDRTRPIGKDPKGNTIYQPIYKSEYYVEQGQVRVDAQGSQSQPGTIRVRMREGSLTLGQNVQGMGVWGNVDVVKPFGGINVNYAVNSNGGLYARSTHGDINVYGISGHCNIIMTSYPAESNIKVAFAKITTGSFIRYEGNSVENRMAGHITIALLSVSGIHYENIAYNEGTENEYTETIEHPIKRFPSSTICTEGASKYTTFRDETGEPNNLVEQWRLQAGDTPDPQDGLRINHYKFRQSDFKDSTYGILYIYSPDSEVHIIDGGTFEEIV